MGDQGPVPIVFLVPEQKKAVMDWQLKNGNAFSGPLLFIFTIKSNITKMPTIENIIEVIALGINKFARRFSSKIANPLILSLKA